MGISNLTSSIRGVSGNENITNINKLETTNLVVTNATLSTLTNLKSVNATITNASIQKLRAVNASMTNASIQTLNTMILFKAVNASMTEASIQKLRAVNASMTNASIQTLNTMILFKAVNASMTEASIQKLRAVNASITNASVNSLSVPGGIFNVGTGSGYMNLNATVGINGYGIRDNSGVVEHKHSGGSWGAISLGYVDLGDTSGFDLTATAMTLDSTWVDWDLGPGGAGIIPAGATGVRLIIKAMTNAIAGKSLQFRENGNSNEGNMLHNKQLIAAVNQPWGGTVACDASGIIEYFGTGTAGNWTTIQIIVRGYFT